MKILWKLKIKRMLATKSGAESKKWTVVSIYLSIQIYRFKRKSTNLWQNRSHSTSTKTDFSSIKCPENKSRPWPPKKFLTKSIKKCKKLMTESQKQSKSEINCINDKAESRKLHPGSKICIIRSKTRGDLNPPLGWVSMSQWSTLVSKLPWWVKGKDWAPNRATTPAATNNHRVPLSRTWDIMCSWTKQISLCEVNKQSLRD